MRVRPVGVPRHCAPCIAMDAPRCNVAPVYFLAAFTGSLTASKVANSTL